MPAIEPTAPQPGASQSEFKFPPVTREHILHCSYDYWFPKYRTSCIKSRIIPLTPEFISFLHEDGIILADEGNSSSKDDPTASGDDDDDDDDWEPSFQTSDYPPPRGDESDPISDSDSESDHDDDNNEPSPSRQPPNIRFPELHAEITSTIKALGGAACPKLNWSSPKDATWISRHPNTMKCTSANDVYILLKSSNFITHDLDHAFDDTVSDPSSKQQPQNTPEFKPVLVLRAFFNPLPSLEFRCFVKSRALIAITQRDLNYYSFLDALRPQIVRRARELFRTRLRHTFPDPDFVFDVYIPEADYRDASDSDDDREKKILGRARLIDINPWAPRTDTLLFDWRELLERSVKRPMLGRAGGGEGADGEVQDDDEQTSSSDEAEEEDDDEEPEVRLVEKDDPAAYNFSSPQYSAHKLPKDVVDASMAGEGGMREFARRWQRMTERRGR